MENKNEFLDRLNTIMEQTKDINNGIREQSPINNMTAVNNAPEETYDDLELGAHNDELEIDNADIMDLVNEINAPVVTEPEPVDEPDFNTPNIQPNGPALEPTPEQVQQNAAQNVQRVAQNQVQKTRAQIAQEKYAPIKRQDPIPEPVNKESRHQTGDSLFDAMDNLDNENSTISERLAKAQEEQMRSIEQAQQAQPIEDPGTNENETGGDDINMIIANMGEVPIEKKEEEQDLDKLLEEYETSKVFADLPELETAGPSDYIIEADDSYDSNIETILERNEIKVVNKNAADRDAILDKYVNSGDKITMVLPNSGIYVTMSGAGATEIIDMNNMTMGSSSTQHELEKLNHVCQHITGSSVGKLKLAELIKIVSYWDIDCLYYALFAATHPTISEISKTCDKCHQEYFLKAHTKDLMINPEDFEKDITDIRDNVTTMARLKETSKLGKVYKKAHSNGMIIYYKHPSIEAYLRTQNALTDETKEKHDNIIDLAYGIDKIAIRVKGNEFIEYTDPNEIINIVSKMKNVDEKYEIFDMIETITPNAKPIFGFKETVCPICGGTSSMNTFTMDSLLFTQAQQEEYEASLRWAARTQKRNQNRKKSKNA